MVPKYKYMFHQTGISNSCAQFVSFLETCSYKEEDEVLVNIC